MMPGSDSVPPSAPGSSLPLNERIPTGPLGSPVHLLAHDGDVRWWKPTWRNAWRYLGWRWVLFLPALAVLCAMAAVVIEPRLIQYVWFIGFKLLIILLCLPFIAAGYAMKSGVQARKEPFCIHCGYDLSGLPDNHRCPECGVPYDFKAIDEYRRDPDWFIQRYKAQRNARPEQVPFDAGAARPGPRRRSRDGT